MAQLAEFSRVAPLKKTWHQRKISVPLLPSLVVIAKSEITLRKKIAAMTQVVWN
jgi:hypothetical protein